MQVSTAVWNEIASSQALSPPWAQMFRMDPTELVTAIAEQDARLESQGASNAVILSYRIVAPLLLENEAISSFLVETNQLHLRS